MRLLKSRLPVLVIACGMLLLDSVVLGGANANSNLIACDIDADCSDPTPFCNQATSECVECLVDSHCDDGAFCDGLEECAIDGRCLAGSPPCEGTGLLCDEDDDQCGPCSEGSASEREPDCGFDENGNQDDVTNGGCFAAEPLFSNIACGDQICGTVASPGIFDFALPDTDWYEIEVENDEVQLTWTVVAEFDVAAFIFAAGPDPDQPCVGFEMLATGAGGAFDEVTVSRCVAPGTYFLVVVPVSLFPIACGAQYSADLACDDCPQGACCALDGGCTDEVTEVACAGEGGEFQGGGTDCTSVNCPEICGADDSGDCCEGNDSPGCDDAGCCAMVCEVEPFCCDFQWDFFCGFLAADLCGDTCAPQCGDEEAGDCCEGNGTAGCDDQDCCDLVCAVIPTCCTDEWDGTCALAAGVACLDTCAECAEDSDCEDGDECTNDSCDSAGSCVNDDVDCDDSDACTDDSCDVATGCVNVAIDCDDDDGCTTDSCDVDDGCIYAPMACDDNDSCTTDTCEDGACVFAAVNCDDGDACTDDTCEAGNCLNAVKDCDDGNVCTDDSCDAISGQCVNALNVAGCDDNDACTENDSCVNGDCGGSAIAGCILCVLKEQCPGDLDCIDGVCQPAQAAPCAADEDCLEGESCISGACRAGCAADEDCGEGQNCVNSFCYGACTADTNCDDGVWCNGPETCTDNACTAGDPACEEGQDCDEAGKLCTEPEDACGVGMGCTLQSPAMALTLFALLGLRTWSRKRRR